MATSVSQASTIIKLNLGGTGPDLNMTAAGLLSTSDDGIVATTGNQNTNVEYTDFLNPLADINTTTASFSLAGLQTTGAAQQVGSIAIQSFNNGQFSLYDPSNVLLLQGPLVNSVLTGVVGAPGTGAVFTTTLSTVTGGTLAPFILPNTLSVSMNLTNINGGAGLSITPPGGPGTLGAFTADASVDIAGSPSGIKAPEPATFSLMGMAIAGALAFVSRRTR